MLVNTSDFLNGRFVAAQDSDDAEFADAVQQRRKRSGQTCYAMRYADSKALHRGQRHAVLAGRLGGVILHDYFIP